MTEIAEKLLQWKPILAKKVDNSGSTLLHYLAATDSHYMVRQLLKHDTSPAYVSDSEGLCPIHVASCQGRCDVVRELINSCPDMDELVNKEGRNFFHIAVEHDSAEIVKFVCQSLLFMKMIISKDYNGNTLFVLLRHPRTKAMMGIVTKFGGEWEQMDDELLDALQRGTRDSSEDYSLLRRKITLWPLMSVVLVKQAQELRGVTVGGNSALHIVATFGHLELAKRICARDCSLLEARNAALETPLHCAARSGADRIVSLFILEFRRWEEVLRAIDRKGKTALHTEILIELEPPAEGGKQAAGTTSAGATQKISYAGPEGQTALHAAAIVQSPGIANKLLQWKPKLAKKVDNSRNTPLHYLVATTNTDMVGQLLSYDISPAYLSALTGVIQYILLL
uniref:Uncharacterized protein n=1 Tax=Ananas comosus var. bracteatus TaxID=296719 RepID=A0A6V7PKJ0_ANACO|nr:unnamed protein product [Ananas comosus var. bracteatus]